jgi:FG-GAP-like repeat
LQTRILHLTMPDKKKLVLLVFLIVAGPVVVDSHNLAAQEVSFSEPENLYTGALSWDFVVSDLDSDLDLDVLVSPASITGQEFLRWYNNSDGQFAAQIHGIGQVRSLLVADFDNDSDADLISNCTGNMWENLDGKWTLSDPFIPFQDFGQSPCNSNTDNIDGNSIAADLDNDGDTDILVARKGEGISWFEKDEDSGLFKPQQVISTAISSDLIISTGDIDGDGFVDILLAARNDDKIAWYRNQLGEPGALADFSSQQVIEININDAWDAIATDIDGDGDQDVVSASEDDNTIAWYENTDGLGTFGAKQIVTNEAAGATVVRSADIDNDGDMDLAWVTHWDQDLKWSENLDGQGAFGNPRVIATATVEIDKFYLRDLDGDGDIDAISRFNPFGPSQKIAISWNELITVTHLDAAPQTPSTALEIHNYPNPFVQNTKISFTVERREWASVRVFDLLGRLQNIVFEGIMQPGIHEVTLEASQLPVGILFIVLETDERSVTRRMVHLRQ